MIERVPVFNSAAVLNESPASIHIVSMLSGAWQLVESGDQRAEVWVWVQKLLPLRFAQGEKKYSESAQEREKVWNLLHWVKIVLLKFYLQLCPDDDGFIIWTRD